MTASHDPPKLPPAVLLCGGMGTRLAEETGTRPKPMVEIGGKPILWHIMKHYARYGVRDFVLCLGYLGHQIREFFFHYDMLTRDFTVTLGAGDLEPHAPHAESGWRVTCADTGAQTMTGARVKRVEHYVRGDRFLLTYGDGVSDVNLDALLAFHRAQGKIGTVTGVHPPSRFGELLTDGPLVRTFQEKPLMGAGGLINGGFFVFERAFFEYLSSDEGCVLEQRPLQRLAADGQLAVFRHDGFWQCVDTMRELSYLRQRWEQGTAPWKVWTD